MVSWLHELELWPTDYLTHRAGAAPESHIQPSLPTEQPHQAFPMDLQGTPGPDLPLCKDVVQGCAFREKSLMFAQNQAVRGMLQRSVCVCPSWSTDLASVTSAHVVRLYSDTALPL